MNLKNTLEIIVAASTIVTFIWATVKYVYPFFLKGIYLYNNGHNILKGFEEKFGSNASNTLSNQVLKLMRREDINEYRISILEEETGYGIYVCSTDGKCIYANKKLCSIFKKSIDEMLNYGWSKSILTEDRANALTTWKNSVAYQMPYQDEYRIGFENDDPIGIQTKADPIFDGEELKYYIGIVWEMSSITYRDKYILNKK